MLLDGNRKKTPLPLSHFSLTFSLGVLLLIIIMCSFFLMSLLYNIHWMRITIGKITEIHFNSIPFVFSSALLFVSCIFFLSFHFDLNIQWQGDERKNKKKGNETHQWMAYGNLTLGMAIKMQSKSICFACDMRSEAETKHANTNTNSQLNEMRGKWLKTIKKKRRIRRKFL